MNYDIAATESTDYHWLTTETVWDLDPALYDQIARAAADYRWSGVTHMPAAAALARTFAVDYLDTGLIAATGTSARTLWISKAKPYRTKPFPHVLTGIREITAEGTRTLLVLTGSNHPVPIAVCERALLGPPAETPCAASAHHHCPGHDDNGRTCRCPCGCRRPDRLTVYRHLVIGDEATDLAWQWPFTVTADPESDEHGGLSVEVRGDDEQVSELAFRGPTEPVIIHNAWRPTRNPRETAGPEPPA